MIQIILTIVAWFRGWKWYALIPMGCAFILGLFIGMTGGPNVVSAAIFADVLANIALIVMCIVKPKVKNMTEKEKEKVAE